jgi:hypothetical protein
MFRDTQFHGFGSQEPQCPTAVAFGRFPAAQGDDLAPSLRDEVMI